MKKKMKMFYLVLGFVAGVSYLIACGGSSKVEEAVGQATTSVITALSVTYDNATSALQATNVQTAVDEVVTKIRALENSSSTGLTAATLVGTWSGNQYHKYEKQSGVSITFNADGGMSCTGGIINSDFAPNNPYCSGNVTWELLGNSIAITNNGVADNAMYSHWMLKVDSFDGTHMGLYRSGHSIDNGFFYGTKM